MTSSQIAAFPVLTIAMNGASIDIPPQQYLVDGYCGEVGYFALAIEPYNYKSIILGDTVHRPYMVIYDRINSRIGFAQSNLCPTP